MKRNPATGAGEGEGAAPRQGGAHGEEATRPARPQPYLRTVYPLNPGIPHFIDFPGGWK